MNITKNQPFSKAVTYDSALSAYAKLLYYTLERLVGADGCVQATVDYLAQLTGTSARTVMRYTPMLEKAGYIRVVRAPRNSKIPNVYRLCDVPQSQPSMSDSPIGANDDSAPIPAELTPDVPVSQSSSAPTLPQSLPDVPQSQSNVCMVDTDEAETIKPKQDKTVALADLPHVTGMTRDNMAKLVAQYGLERVKAAVEYANQQTNLYNKPGFVVRLVQGQIAGLDWQPVSAEERRMRYVTGKYADFIQW